MNYCIDRKNVNPSLSDGLNWNNRNENWIEEIEDD